MYPFYPHFLGSSYPCASLALTLCICPVPPPGEFDHDGGTIAIPRHAKLGGRGHNLWWLTIRTHPNISMNINMSIVPWPRTTLRKQTDINMSGIYHIKRVLYTSNNVRSMFVQSRHSCCSSPKLLRPGTGYSISYPRHLTPPEDPQTSLQGWKLDLELDIGWFWLKMKGI